MTDLDDFVDLPVRLDAISERLDAALPVSTPDRPQIEHISSSEVKEESDRNIKELIDMGMSTIPTMINLMNESQSDKMFTAGAAVLKTMFELNEKWQEMNKPQQKQQQQSTSPTTINHVYYGSTEDMLKRKREQRKMAQKAIEDAEIVDSTSTIVEPSSVSSFVPSNDSSSGDSTDN